MKVAFIEKKFKATTKFKDIVKEKLSKLAKYFDGEVEAKVFCTKENKTEKLEVNLIYKGIMFRSEAYGNSNFENIDLILPKLEKQIVRSKQKFIKGRRKNQKVDAFEYLAEEPDLTLADISKTKRFDLDPITTDEAKDAIERLGHTFYIFLNAETGKVNVLYKRKDTKYGLIEVDY